MRLVPVILAVALSTLLFASIVLGDRESGPQRTSVFRARVPDSVLSAFIEAEKWHYSPQETVKVDVWVANHDSQPLAVEDRCWYRATVLDSVREVVTQTSGSCARHEQRVQTVAPNGIAYLGSYYLRLNQEGSETVVLYSGVYSLQLQVDLKNPSGFVEAETLLCVSPTPDGCPTPVEPVEPLPITQILGLMVLGTALGLTVALALLARFVGSRRGRLRESR